MRRLLLLGTLLLAAPALAAVARPATVEELARGADAVVRGRVERRESRLSADGRHVYTLVTLEVSQVWRGSAPGRVVVWVPGGEVGDLGQVVDGAPRFGDGEEVVVFLAGSEARGFQVHGLAQGKFEIRGAEARPGLEGVAFVPERLPGAERRVEAMPVEELERRVRTAP